jgi:hypothetical protein
VEGFSSRRFIAPDEEYSRMNLGDARPMKHTCHGTLPLGMLWGIPS